MKNNRKNKKLKFIREKNKLRLGFIKFYCIEKSSLNPGDYDVNRLISIAKKSLLKEYNLKLPIVEYMHGTEGDDFLKNIITFRVSLSLK